MALQVVTTLYRRIAGLTTILPLMVEDREKGSVKVSGEVLLRDMGEALTDYLPEVVKQFQEEDSTLVLSQVAILVQLFRLKQIRFFVDDLAKEKGTTIEYFTIKLWLGLEDSFQSLVEITEAFKNAGSEGIEDGEERLQAAFAAVAIAASALRAFSPP